MSDVTRRNFVKFAGVGASGAMGGASWFQDGQEVPFGGLAPVQELPEIDDDIFLQLDGVTGESVDAQHEGEIEALAWSWGMAQPHSADGRSTGKTEFAPLSIIKTLDAASPVLMMHLVAGQTMRQGRLTLRSSTGDAPVEYLTFSMENVRVNRLEDGTDSVAGRYVERMTLSFSQVEIEYIPISADGSAGDPVSFGWDLADNRGI